MADARLQREYVKDVQELRENTSCVRTINRHNSDLPIGLQLF